MLAFPDAQRRALTRLRESNPRAALSVPRRQNATALRVVLRWPARTTGERYLKRTAYVGRDGQVILAKRSMGTDRQVARW